MSVQLTLADFGSNYISAWQLYMRNTMAELAPTLIRAQREGGIRGRAKHGLGDIVTPMDSEIERKLADVLRSFFPDLPIFGEELNPEGDMSGVHTRLDPIDGTSNFDDGLPLFANSAALMEGDATRALVIMQPDGMRTWYYLCDPGKQPSEGHATFYEPNVGQHGQRFRPLQARERWAKTLGEATLDIRITARGRTPEAIQGSTFAIAGRIMRLSGHVRALRCIGSASLVCAYVADGVLDAAIFNGKNTWDAVPGRALAESQGALTLNMRNEPWTPEEYPMILTSPRIRDELMATLAPLRSPAP